MSKLQFCQATVGEIFATIQFFFTPDVAEIQRVSVVAISSLQHRVTKTVSCSNILSPHTPLPDYIAQSPDYILLSPQTTLPTGHVVPEGSIAMTNIKKFLSDPELWDQPEQFNPER